MKRKRSRQRWRAFCRLVGFCCVSQRGGGGGKKTGDNADGKLFVDLLFVWLRSTMPWGGGKGAGDNDELFVELLFVCFAFRNMVRRRKKRRAKMAMASCLPTCCLPLVLLSALEEKKFNNQPRQCWGKLQLCCRCCHCGRLIVFHSQRSNLLACQYGCRLINLNFATQPLQLG